MKIAVSGKGGVGKTTVSAGLINYFAEKGNRVFAVDADPDVSLGTVLGLSSESVDNLKPIVDMREVIKEKSGGGGAFFNLNPDVNDVIEDFTVSKNNINFLKMGAIKQGGSACYCRENSVLNALLNRVVLKEKQYVLLDMGAGIEHLTRGTANGVDIMIVVTEPSQVSVQTARTVEKLAKEIGIKNIKFIGNKIRNLKEEDFLNSKLQPNNILGFIHYSDEILDAALDIENSSGSFIPEELKDIAEKVIKVSS